CVAVCFTIAEDRSYRPYIDTQIPDTFDRPGELRDTTTSFMDRFRANGPLFRVTIAAVKPELRPLLSSGNDACRLPRGCLAHLRPSADQVSVTGLRVLPETPSPVSPIPG